MTAEEQFITGGMGVNIARVVAETHPVPMRLIGIRDGYPGSGIGPRTAGRPSHDRRRHRAAGGKEAVGG